MVPNAVWHRGRHDRCRTSPARAGRTNRPRLLGLRAFGFADAGPDARRADGRGPGRRSKTATTSLAVDYVIDGQRPPTVGERSVVFGSDLRPVAIVETTAWRLWTIGLVDDAFAAAEGEGYATRPSGAPPTRRSGIGTSDDYRRDLGDPDFEVTTSTVVVCEWFRLVERLDGTDQSPS